MTKLRVCTRANQQAAVILAPILAAILAAILISIHKLHIQTEARL